MIGPVEERAYELLVTRPGVTMQELSALWQGSAPLAGVLARLEVAGLVTVQPGPPARYAASGTDNAARLLDEQEAEIERLRAHIGSLAGTYRRLREGGEPHPAALITGRQAIDQTIAQVHRIARNELRCLEEGGLAPLAGDPPCRRVVAGAVEGPGGLEAMAHLIGEGHQIRIAPDVPVRMYLAEQRAVLPLSDAHGEAAIIVYPCALLDALHKLFHVVWARAVPLQLPAARTATDLGDDSLVMMLLSGLTDEAIARHVGAGVRTVQRRIATLMRDLGAHTRFQAGVQAALRRRYHGR